MVRGIKKTKDAGLEPIFLKAGRLKVVIFK